MLIVFHPILNMRLAIVGRVNFGCAKTVFVHPIYFAWAAKVIGDSHSVKGILVCQKASSSTQKTLCRYYEKAKK